MCPHNKKNSTSEHDIQEDLTRIMCLSKYSYNKKYGMDKVNKFVNIVRSWILTIKKLPPYSYISFRKTKLKKMIKHIEETLDDLKILKDGKFPPLPQVSIDDIRKRDRLIQRLEYYSKSNKLAGEVYLSLNELKQILVDAENILENEKLGGSPPYVVTGLVDEIARIHANFFEKPSGKKDCAFGEIVDYVFEHFGLSTKKNNHSRIINKAIQNLPDRK